MLDEKPLFKIHASRAALGLAHVSSPTFPRSLTTRLALAALPLVHYALLGGLGCGGGGVPQVPKWCGSLPPPTVPLDGLSLRYRCLCGVSVWGVRSVRHDPAVVG
eukprot:scaffold50817_cov38-Tisochrysis_lutea.AAC.3